MDTAYQLRVFRASLGTSGPLAALLEKAAEELEQLYKAKRGDRPVEEQPEAVND